MTHDEYCQAMAKLGCRGCGATLYYRERKTGQEFCRQCATDRGIDRICDAPLRGP